MKKTKHTGWDEEILSIEGFFSSHSQLRKIKLNGWTTITNPKLFLESHLSIVKCHNGEKLFRPYLDRLIEYKNLINEKDIKT